LDGVRAKYDKKISMLTTNDGKNMIPLADGKISKPDFNLMNLLDEYYSVGEEKGVETSSRLFYFFEYEEIRNEKAGIARLRFWLAAEKLM
jgi:hypothetical protein